MAYKYQTFEADSLDLDPESPFFLDHVARYWWAAEQVKGLRVLDCACGKGYGTYILSGAASQVVGVDLNEESLQMARRVFTRENLTFQSQDVFTLSKLGESFDAITAFEVIEHIPHEKTSLFLNSLKSVLKPGGKLLLSTPNHDVVLKSGVVVPEFHINNFRSVELKKALEQEFSNVTMLGQFRQRQGLSQLLFDWDFLNLRHLVGGFRKRANRKKSEVAGHSVASSNTYRSPDEIVNLFAQPPTEASEYHFSSRHWRQAGLSVAICQK
ncbi:MAG: class I SAM-dependent methyltransferase [Pseudobdellovibrionaceae bacterium]|nr:class I SAM-dependent methyltransferase [Bdellovibrionales bacterium]USN48479.1 MAG: class I SAM-dependent methyltransferase [Pseudobdellovibrionaceae bacterium]